MNSRGPSPPRFALTLDDVVERLALTLGAEKGREVVTTAAATARTFDAGAVLRELQARPGLVGLTARRLLSQLEPHRDETVRAKPSLEPRPPPPEQSTSGEQGRTMSTQSLVELFIPSLGDQAAALLVDSAKKKVGVGGKEPTLSDALRVLELLCAEPGLAGVTARFAKARILLQAKAVRD